MTWPELALTVLGGALAIVAGGVVTLQLLFLVGRAITRRLADPTLPSLGVIQKFAGFDERLFLAARRRDVEREIRRLQAQRRHLVRVLAASPRKVVHHPSAARKTGT